MTEKYTTKYTQTTIHKTGYINTTGNRNIQNEYTNTGNIQNSIIQTTEMNKHVTEISIAITIVCKKDVFGIFPRQMLSPGGKCCVFVNYIYI